MIKTDRVINDLRRNRPQRDIPRPNKAQRLNEFLRRVVEQEAEVRRMMRPDLTLMKAWWGIAD